MGASASSETKYVPSYFGTADYNTYAVHHPGPANITHPVPHFAGHVAGTLPATVTPEHAAYSGSKSRRDAHKQLKKMQARQWKRHQMTLAHAQFQPQSTHSQPRHVMHHQQQRSSASTFTHYRK